MVKVEVPGVCPKNGHFIKYSEKRNTPNSRHQQFWMQIFIVFTVHLHTRHKNLLPKDAFTIVTPFDGQVIAGSQFSTNRLDAETGKDEHNQDHENCYKQDFLYWQWFWSNFIISHFESSKQFNNNPTNVWHQRVDAKRAHGTTNHQELLNGIDFHMFWHQNQKNEACLNIKFQHIN